MKKIFSTILALLLICALVLTLCMCRDKNKEEEGGGDNTPPSSENGGNNGGSSNNGGNNNNGGGDTPTQPENPWGDGGIETPIIPLD